MPNTGDWCMSMVSIILEYFWNFQNKNIKNRFQDFSWKFLDINIWSSGSLGLLWL